MSDEPDLLAVGERVALGPLRMDLAGHYARWTNQTEVKDGTGALGIMVVLRALDWNQQALASYRRAGFRELGRRREAVLSGGRLCDEVYMDVLASEFTGSVLAPRGTGAPDGATGPAGD